MTLVFKTTEHKYYLYPYVLAFLLILYLKDQEMYEKITNNKIVLKDVIEYMCSKNNGKEFIYGKQSSYAGLYFCGSISVFLNTSSQTNVYEYLDSLINDSKTDPDLLDWAKSVKGIGQTTRNGRPFLGMMEYLKNKIEIISPFVM